MVKYAPNGIVTQGPVDVVSSQTFQVSDLLENGAFLILFEEFQIVKVELAFRPMYRANAIVDALIGRIPEIYVAYDPTTAGPPTSVDPLGRYSDVAITDDSDPFVVSFRPRFAKRIYNGLLTDGFEPSVDSDWLSTSDLSIPHYHIFIGITGSMNIAGPFQSWNVVPRYTLRFRGHR
jgi:hypothetical protein